MYSKHPEFESPPDDASLWKYVDFTKFVSLLERQALFFANTERFADPFEGYPGDLLRDGDGNSTQEFAKMIHELKQNVLVDCWHRNESESDAMWRLYSGFEFGIAIKTTVEKLKESLACPEEVFIGGVEYANYRQDSLDERRILAWYLMKRIAFEHEREVRAITVTDEPNPQGDYREVEVDRLIVEVVVAPQSENWFFDLVRAVMTRYGQTAPVRRSSLAEEPPQRPSA